MTHSNREDSAWVHLEELRSALRGLPTFAYEYRPKEQILLPLTTDFSRDLNISGESMTVVDFIRNVLHPDERARLHETFSRGDRVKGEIGDVRESTARVVDRLGVTRTVRWRSRCIEVDEEGVATRVVGVLVDESEQRRLTDRIRTLEKLEAMGRLAGGVAHDFNNLLTAILGSAELAMMSLPPDAQGSRDYLNDIVAAAARGAEMTSSLLRVVTKPDTPAHPIRFDDFVEQSRRVLERHTSSSHTLHIESSADLWVNIEQTQLFQVLQNLIINSCEAMPEGGVVYVTTSKVLDLGGWWAQILVKDTGHGISQKHLPHVFEPFVTTKKKGSGLGLSTVQSIVLGLHGHLDIRSDTSGTSVTIMLPGFESAEEAQAVLTSP